MNNMKNRLFILSLCIIALLSANSCKNAGNSAETKKEEILPDDIVEMRDDQIKLAQIEQGSIEMRVLKSILKVNGIVAMTSQNMATVCEPLGGFVRSASLMPGQPVRKGEILTIIENQDFVDIQEHYLEAKSKLEYAEAEYKRRTDLFRQDVYSEKDVQQVTVEYKSLKTQVKALEQKLLLIGLNPETLQVENITGSVAVKSPMNGFITRTNVNIGKYVAPTDVLFEIVNSDNLFLELTLFDKDADKAEIGQKIGFFINNEDDTHDAVIYQTGKSIGDDKTFKVYARVLSSCKNVLPGMYVNALIERPGNPCASMPSEAIVSFDDQDYIFAYSREKTEDGKPFTEYRMIPVSKGVTDGSFTEVKLPPGLNFSSLRVVVKGAYTLLSAKKNAGEMAC
jgi:membrane fusion protein, heavy metal efflux system